MTRKLIALTAASVVSLGALAPAAQAMTMGDMASMLTGKVYEVLSDNDISTDIVSDLSLNQIVRISRCEEAASQEGSAQSEKQCVEAVIRKPK